MNIFNKNQAGMTLVEVMVAGGLVAGLAVAGMTMFKTQTTAQKTVEQNYEVMTVVSQIRTFLSNPDNCRESLPVNANGGTVNNLRLFPWTTSAQDRFVRNTILPGNVIIRSYTTDTTVPGLIAGQQTALKIVFSRGNNTLKDSIQKNIVISYTGGTPIATCYAAQNQLDSFWIKSIPDPSEIYYMMGNVGIGTPDPATKLHVVGSTGVEGIIKASTTGTTAADYAGIRFMSPNSTLAGGQIYVSGVANSTFFMHNSEPTGDLSFLSGNTERLRILANGNIGVGTATPDVKLALESGPIRAYYAKTIYPNIYGEFFHNGDAGGLEITARGSTGGGSGKIRFLTAEGVPVERMRIDSVGNVGISTPTPTAKVHALMDNSGTVVPLRTAFFAEAPLTSSNGYIMFKGIGGNTFAGGTSYGLNLDFSSSTAGVDYGVYTVGEDRNYFSGNVGIGSTAPPAALTVRSSGTAEGLRLVPQAAGLEGGQLSLMDGTGAGAWELDNYGPDGNEAFRIFRDKGENNLSTPFTINALGRVGVGTANPSYPLHVTGSMYLNAFSSPSFLINEDNNGSNGYTLKVDANVFSIGRYGLTTLNVFGTNVGIGTTSPAYPLQVNGAVAATSFVYVSDKKFKKDVSDIQNPLEKISNLRGVNFTWKDGNKKDIGFIAQEVEKVEPRLVETDVKGMKAVKYGNITALLVEAIKELRRMISDIINDQSEIELKLAQVQQENALLKRRLDEQERKMKNFEQNQMGLIPQKK